MSFIRNNRNRDQFNKQFNDIIIYVEDNGKEGIYLVIFKKLLENLELQVDNIFTCGGKEKVIEKYYEEKNDDKARIYLLDRDFDKLLYKDVSGQRMKGKSYSELESLEGIFYLDKYSIENYFIDSELIIRTIESTIPQDSNNKVIQGYGLRMSKFIEEITPNLISFTAYLLIDKEKNLKVNSYKEINSFYNKREGRILEIEESAFVREVRNKYQEKVMATIENEIDEWKRNITVDDIRGKTIYEIIHKKIHYDFMENIGTYQFQASINAFLYQLAYNSDLKNFRELKNKIISFLEK